MQIPSDQGVNPVASDPNVVAKPKSPSAGVAQPVRKNVLATEPSGSQPNNAAATEPVEPTVTFRRDTNGKIYYVLTDPQSGKELRELPPEEVRKVGEGIANYLKQEQEKPTPPRIRVKA